MIIVSQDKEKIVNFDNVNMILVREKKIISFDNTFDSGTDDGDLIGIYETKERAKEVLREIVEEYMDSNNSYGSQGYVKNKTFYMPKE